MRTFFVVLICIVSLASVQIFENLLARHAQHVTQTKPIKSYAQLGPDISFCFAPDVKDFASCVMNLKKSTQ